MTSYDALAVVHGKVDLPDSICVQSAGMTVVFIPKPGHVRLLPLSRKSVLQNAADRQEMLENLMPYGTVLPFRPGVSLSPEDGEGFIRTNHPVLHDLAVRFADTVQFQITVSWAAEKVLTRFRGAPELAVIFTNGQTSARALKHAVTALATRLGDEMTGLLRPVATDLRSLPCVEHMLLNTVLTVPAAQILALDNAVEAIDAIWSDGLQIRQIGPAPVASFATLDLRAIGAPEVEKSRQLLGLNGAAETTSLAAARREALLRAPHKAETIRAAAEIVALAERSDDLPCFFCTIIAEGEAAKVPATVSLAASA